MATPIISREEAARLGLKRYFTGTPCRRGHITERMVSNTKCLTCHADWMRIKGAKIRREANRRWKARNPNQYKDYYERSEKERQRSASRRKDPDKSRRDAKNWRARNPEKVRADTAFRTALRRAACPPWADRAEIKAIYVECRRITKETGVQHHVDHFIPVKGETVCGLHVPSNLRIVTAEVNLRKRNNLPEMCQ